MFAVENSITQPTHNDRQHVPEHVVAETKVIVDRMTLFVRNSWDSAFGQVPFGEIKMYE
jgi:hypothetical protein